MVCVATENHDYDEQLLGNDRLGIVEVQAIEQPWIAGNTAI